MKTLYQTAAQFAYTLLAPTTPRRARLLLKKCKAAVFRRHPFTIILKREIVNPSTPDLKLKIDLDQK